MNGISQLPRSRYLPTWPETGKRVAGRIATGATHAIAAVFGKNQLQHKKQQDQSESSIVDHASHAAMQAMLPQQFVASPLCPGLLGCTDQRLQFLHSIDIIKPPHHPEFVVASPAASSLEVIPRNSASHQDNLEPPQRLPYLTCIRTDTTYLHKTLTCI